MPSTVPLTSPLPTGQLPAITPDAVTVTVARTPCPGSEGLFEAALRELVAAAEQAPGSLGAGVLKPGPAHSEWHVVLRFADVVALRRWETCERRVQLLGEVERFTRDTRVVSAPSPSSWFRANDVPVETPVGKRVRDVLWTLPAALSVAAFVAPALYHHPLALRALASALAGVTATALLVGPLRLRVRAWRVKRDPLR